MNISSFINLTSVPLKLSMSRQNPSFVSFGVSKDTFEKKEKFKPIVFKEAKNIQQAKQFGRNVLGIKEYSGKFCERDDLEILNWINEGFVHVHNATKGKAVPPRKVSYYGFPQEEKNWYGALDFKLPFGEITFNADYLRNIDITLTDRITTAKSPHSISDKKGVFFIDASSDIKSPFAKTPCLVTDKKGNAALSSLFEKNKNAQKFEKLLNKYISKSDSISFKEKIALNFSLKSVLNAKYELCKNYTTQKQKSYQLKGSKGISSASAGKLTFVQGSPWHCAAHESGHLQHFVNDDKFLRALECGDEEHMLWRRFETGDKEIAAKISAYAFSSPYEFVAETFAKIVCNPEQKLPDDVISLYHRLGGPIFYCS